MTGARCMRLGVGGLFLAVRKYREDQTSHIHGPDQVRSQKFYNLSLKPQSHKDFLPSRKNVLPHPPFICLQKWASLRCVRQCGQLPIVCGGNPEDQEERRNPSRDEKGHRGSCRRDRVPERCRQNQKPRLRLCGVRESSDSCHGPKEVAAR